MANFWFGLLLSEFEDPSPSKNHMHVTASTTSDSNYFKFIELSYTSCLFFLRPLGCMQSSIRLKPQFDFRFYVILEYLRFYLDPFPNSTMQPRFSNWWRFIKIGKSQSGPRLDSTCCQITAQVKNTTDLNGNTGRSPHIMIPWHPLMNHDDLGIWDGKRT